MNPHDLTSRLRNHLSGREVRKEQGINVYRGRAVTRISGVNIKDNRRVEVIAIDFHARIHAYP